MYKILSKLKLIISVLLIIFSVGYNMASTNLDLRKDYAKYMRQSRINHNQTEWVKDMETRKIPNLILKKESNSPPNKDKVNLNIMQVQNHSAENKETIICDEDIAYKGALKNGMYEGYGTLRDKEGNIWVGEWKAGYPFNGNGSYKDWIGTYKGAWKNGMYEGVGEITYRDGGVYHGTWKENSRSGYGRMKYWYGGEYEGEWENDKRAGHGAYTYRNGIKYRGIWKDNYPYNGMEYMVICGVEQIIGEWINGTFSQKQEGAEIKNGGIVTLTANNSEDK